MGVIGVMANAVRLNAETNAQNYPFARYHCQVLNPLRRMIKITRGRAAVTPRRGRLPEGKIHETATASRAGVFLSTPSTAKFAAAKKLG